MQVVGVDNSSLVGVLRIMAAALKSTHLAFLQAKEGFYALLDGCAELRSGGRPKFSRARDLLELDARWQVCCVRLPFQAGNSNVDTFTALEHLRPPLPLVGRQDVLQQMIQRVVTPYLFAAGGGQHQGAGGAV